MTFKEQVLALIDAYMEACCKCKACDITFDAYEHLKQNIQELPE